MEQNLTTQNTELNNLTTNEQTTLLNEENFNHQNLNETLETNLNASNNLSKNQEKLEEEKNSFYAQRRRQSQKEKLTEELTEKVAVETAKKIIGEVNPFTNKPFQTTKDLEDYFEQKLKKEEKNAQNEQKIENSSDEWFINDRIKFFEQHPDFTEVQFEKLLTDDDFIDFSKTRVGNDSLTNIYSDYVKYNEKIDDLATKKAQDMFRKQFSSPGSLSKAFLTNKSSLDNLSEQEFEKMIKDAKSGYYSSKK